jgi:outer membrane protein assembly factor BamB
MAIAGGRLYTQGAKRGLEFVIALDAATGKLLWETPYAKAFKQGRGNGPRGTPTVDGNRMYALSGDGTLVCLDAESGKPLWTQNIMKQFGGDVIHWGISESPLVDGDRVIVTPGGKGASLVALNKMTGALIWKTQSGEAGYSSPLAIDFGGKRQIVAFNAKMAFGVLASNGELLWRYDKVANGTANIATPIHRDGYLFLSSDYGTGCALLRIDPDTGKASEVYFNRDMKNHYSTSVLVGNHLYGFSSAILTAMEFETGKVAWRDRSTGKGSVTYADGRLYVLGENGTVALVEASPAAYREISRFSIAKGEYPTWTPPVVANKRLYLRDQDTLYCYDIAGK